MAGCDAQFGGLGRFIGLLAVLITIVGCVQPIEPTPTPDPFAAPSPISADPSVPVTIAVETPTPTEATTTFAVTPQQIGSWIQLNYAITGTNIQIYNEQIVGSDALVGFTFQHPDGRTCAGLAQTSATQIFSDSFGCAPPGTQIVTGDPLFFAPTSTSNIFYVAAFGFVDPITTSTATSIIVEFADGSRVSQPLVENGFIVAQQFASLPSQAIVIDSSNNVLSSVAYSG